MDNLKAARGGEITGLYVSLDIPIKIISNIYLIDYISITMTIPLNLNGSDNVLNLSTIS
jgi:hypothetical protein